MRRGDSEPLESRGTPDRGERLVAGLQARMDAIEAQAGQSDYRPSVACIERIDPLMAVGNWMPELVAMAGGENVFGDAGRHSPWLTWEALCGADPDIFMILPCGYDIAETRRNMPALTGRQE